MDVHRIMPTTVAPERQPVTRRERDGQDRRDGEDRHPPEKPRGARLSEQAVNAEESEAQVGEEQEKGRRLNVSA